MEETNKFPGFYRAQQRFVRFTTQSCPSGTSTCLHWSLSGTAPTGKNILKKKNLHPPTIRALDLTFKTMLATPCLSRVMGQVSHFI